MNKRQPCLIQKPPSMLNETAKTSFINLIHLESLKGEVKEAINAKITNHQVPLLTNFSNVLAVLLAQYEKSIKQFQSEDKHV